MSVLLRRHMPPETVTLEVQVGLDGQGKPEYDSPVDIEAHVRRTDTKDANSNVRMGSGSEVKTMCMIFVDAEVTPVPAMDDRVTLEDGLVGIVIEVKPVKNLQSILDHTQLKVREE